MSVGVPGSAASPREPAFAVSPCHTVGTPGCDDDQMIGDRSNREAQKKKPKKKVGR